MSEQLTYIHLFFLSICINYAVSSSYDISTEECHLQRVKPDHLKYLSLKVANKDTDHPSYNLEVESQADRAIAPYGARFLTVDNGNCSAQCTHKIVAFRPRSRDVRTHRTILYALDFQETMIAPNYQDVQMDAPIRCARQFGFCGATIGLYRHFRYTPGGLLNAYSFSSQVNIRGFTREYYPMCYLWTLPDDLKIIGSGNMVGRSPRATTSMCMSNESMPINELQILRVYDNFAPGTQRDHYYTITTNETNPDLAGYSEQSPLGRVALSSSPSCDCLTKVVQMVDKQEGIFRRLDHKIVIDGGEANRPYEQYVATGESFYCATEMACGATLPLWKSFHYFDVDSVISTNSDPIPYSYLYPQLPLCYIWPAEMEQPNTGNPTLVATSQSTTLSPTTISTPAVNGITVENTSMESVTTDFTEIPINIDTLGPDTATLPNVWDTTIIPITTADTISFPIDNAQPGILLPEVSDTTPPYFPGEFLFTSTDAPFVGGVDTLATANPSVVVTDLPSVMPTIDGVIETISTAIPSVVITELPSVVSTMGGGVDTISTADPFLLTTDPPAPIPTLGGGVDTLASTNPFLLTTDSPSIIPTINGVIDSFGTTSPSVMNTDSSPTFASVSPNLVFIKMSSAAAIEDTTVPNVEELVMTTGDLSSTMISPGGVTVPTSSISDGGLSGISPVIITEPLPPVTSTQIPSLTSFEELPVTDQVINSDDPIKTANMNKMLPDMSSYLINLFFGYENVGKSNSNSSDTSVIVSPTAGITANSTDTVNSTETTSQVGGSSNSSTVFTTYSINNEQSSLIRPDPKTMNMPITTAVYAVPTSSVPVNSSTTNDLSSTTDAFMPLNSTQSISTQSSSVTDDSAVTEVPSNNVQNTADGRGRYC